jgi:Peptidase family M1 domain
VALARTGRAGDNDSHGVHLPSRTLGVILPLIRFPTVVPASVRAALVCLGLVAPAVLVSPGPSAAAAAPAAGTAGWADCSPGSHTLGAPNDRLYPDTGNGGYRSLHTNVDLVYNATGNRFLAGTQVQLTDQATQCLTSLSLDLERTSADKVAGPDLTVGSVSVDGQPATIAFVQPTYPGDPAGQNDPNPASHEVSQTDPVGGPAHNPLPPACSPELTSTAASGQNAQNGMPCPATKLVVMPSVPIRCGATFTVTVTYTGRPGVHHDGDGTTEGWFRASDGGFVTTEPVGSEDWMPLNDFPTAKPTYDFYDTIAAGKTAIANGILVSTTRHAASAAFPTGSVTWHWRSVAPIANYLVEDSIGNYTLTRRTGADGVIFYEAQDTSIPPARRAANLKIMDLQQNITDFESGFSGPYPFTSAGIVIGTPPASFEEEMQTMITFAGGLIGTSVLYHENMHQWWGDHVTESAYNMTFYKEGLATLAQGLYTARTAEDAAGGPNSGTGKFAFEASLIKQFNALYASRGSFWSGAPSNPTPRSLFAEDSTYNRPEAAYLALRQILGPAAFDGALRQIQASYGGGNIDEAQLEAAFHQAMPNQSRSCSDRLDTFFREWFDTPYPGGGGANRPQVTGPGLAGPGFYDSSGGCH